MTINWQPLSTAPLDGTDILVYDGLNLVKKLFHHCSTNLLTGYLFLIYYNH